MSILEKLAALAQTVENFGALADPDGQMRVAIVAFAEHVAADFAGHADALAALTDRVTQLEQRLAAVEHAPAIESDVRGAAVPEKVPAAAPVEPDHAAPVPPVGVAVTTTASSGGAPVVTGTAATNAAETG